MDSFDNGDRRSAGDAAAYLERDSYQTVDEYRASSTQDVELGRESSFSRSVRESTPQQADRQGHPQFLESSDRERARLPPIAPRTQMGPREGMNYRPMDQLIGSDWPRRRPAPRSPRRHEDLREVQRRYNEPRSSFDASRGYDNPPRRQDDMTRGYVDRQRGDTGPHRSVDPAGQYDDFPRGYAGGDRGKIVAKPDRFDGKEDLSAYLQHFSLCSTLNGWSDRDKAQFLAVSLAGEARQVINGLDLGQIQDYGYIVSALQARFDPVGRTELHRVQLKNKVREPNESLAALADHVRILVERVFGELPMQSKDKMARDHFIDALNDGDMRTRVLQMRTTTLKEAAAAAVELEALQRAEKERSGPSKRVREVHTAEKTAANPSLELAKVVGELADKVSKLQMGERRQGGRAGSKNPDVVCFYCEEVGHIKRHCPQLKPSLVNKK